MAPRAGEHLHLQAAFARRQEYLLSQRGGRVSMPAAFRLMGQRRRAALVLFLRKERYRVKLHVRRQAGAALVQQCVALRQADAGAQGG